ncbi:hypothetical protein RCL1_006785 [Eukaryota sp. TZLM3-RCL]
MLDLNLNEFEDRVASFVNKLTSSVDSLMEQHETNFSSLSTDKSSLEIQREKLESELKQLQSKVSDEFLQIQRLEDQILHISSTNSRIKPQIAQLEQELSHMNLEQTNTLDLLQAERSKTEHVLSHLSQGVSTYRQRLGLSFEKSGSALQFNFTLIDLKSPARMFSAAISIINGNYCWEKSNPEISHNISQQLIQNLNATNSLSKFCISLRKVFCTIANS